MIESHGFHHLQEKLLPSYQESFEKAWAAEEQIFRACIQSACTVAHETQDQVPSPKAMKAPIWSQANAQKSIQDGATASPSLRVFWKCEDKSIVT